jgi:hypothetical protein
LGGLQEIGQRTTRPARLEHEMFKKNQSNLQQTADPDRMSRPVGRAGISGKECRPGKVGRLGRREE